MALLGATISLLTIIVLAVIAMCRDPWAEPDQRPEPTARAFSVIPALPPPPRSPNLPESLLQDRLRLYRIDGRAADTNLPRSFTVSAKNIGAATVKARKWGMKIDAVRREER